MSSWSNTPAILRPAASRRPCPDGRRGSLPMRRQARLQASRGLLERSSIGPGDLATSMGLKGRTDDLVFIAATGKLESAIKTSPVSLGGVAHTPEQAGAMMTRGYRALVVGFDWSLLQRGIAAAIAGIRSAAWFDGRDGVGRRTRNDHRRSGHAGNQPGTGGGRALRRPGRCRRRLQADARPFSSDRRAAQALGRIALRVFVLTASGRRRRQGRGCACRQVDRWRGP
jgi:hypothetical protein